MDPSRWNEVTAVFSAAVEIEDAVARAAFLSSYAEDPVLRAEVEALLASWAQSASLEEPALSHQFGVAVVGQRIGPYRVTREIGRGGMGVVFEAERVDGQFERRVALKFVVGPLWPDLQRRFHRERQILAALEHPNIIRLLDAGISADGLPYLVMDYVDGVPITEYCRQQSLPKRECLALFRTICEAVHHAHQRLVVHRDLKPGNILVDGSGKPRLLDFGISRLMAETGGEETTGLSRLTLNYASPEQLRGETLSTASDIYSLGVILYGLLTSKNPYDLTGRSLPEAMRHFSAASIQPPSQAIEGYRGGTLRGDLDAIVLKAMRPEPEQRYASAEEFGRDVQRYLNEEPVLARPPSLAYRAGRFVHRHTLATIVVSLSILGLIAATGIAVYQEGKVRLERERALAQLNATRDLANSLLFDYQEALARIPGTLEVRKRMIGRALQHLEQVAAEATTEQLQFEVAEAWARLGDLQGGSDWSLGDRPAALKSYGQAKLILERILREKNQLGASLDVIAVSTKMFSLLRMEGRREESAALRRQFQDRLEDLMKRYPENESVVRLSASDEFQRGELTEDRKERLQHWLRSLDGYESLLKRAPDDDKRVYSVAIMSKRVAAALATTGRVGDAQQHVQRAIELERSQLTKRPEDARLRLDYTFSLSTLAGMHLRQRHYISALDLYREIVSTRRELLAAEPANGRLRGSLVSGLLAYGNALDTARYSKAAAEVFVEVSKLGSLLPPGHDRDHYLNRANQGLARLRLGARK